MAVSKMDLKITYREFRHYIRALGFSMTHLTDMHYLFDSILPYIDIDGVYYNQNVEKFRDFLWEHHNSFLDKTLEDCIILFKLQEE